MSVSNDTPMPEVEVPGPNRTTRRHRGWPVDPADTWGYAYPQPFVLCPRCRNPMDVTEVRAVGGVHSLLWTMECAVCNIKHVYPATDFSTEEVR